ncbi:MAG TPA: hypothetical protein VGC93_08810 [Thermoanaerobaculia bacterium]
MKRLGLVALLTVAACAAGPADGRYPSLRADGEPLRSSFNQAAGKVRAVFLAAPT